MIPNLQSHYGFTRMPFTKDIPVAALFSSAACKEAVARLRWLISARGLYWSTRAVRGSGVMSVPGEAGAVTGDQPRGHVGVRDNGFGTPTGG